MRTIIDIKIPESDRWLMDVAVYVSWNHILIDQRTFALLDGYDGNCVSAPGPAVIFKHDKKPIEVEYRWPRGRERVAPRRTGPRWFILFLSLPSPVLSAQCMP